MNKINLPEIEILYEYAVKFYNKELLMKEAKHQLEERGIKQSTTQDYLYNYKYLIEGKRYTRTINTLAIRFYLDKIFKTFGKDILKNALNAMDLHIRYYEKASGNRVKKQKQILEEYTSKYEITLSK